VLACVQASVELLSVPDSMDFLHIVLVGFFSLSLHF
jgi:hypothetical protein